jgi:O-antigen/teichoic acid export membrane protein
MLSIGGPLKHQVVRGSLWLLLNNTMVRATGFVKIAIMARLLAPDDFGLMGIAMLLLTWLEYFTEPGFTHALLRKAGDIRPYLNTVWTIQILRCVTLALLLYLSAPLGGWFFDNPSAVPVVQAAALILVFKGFANPAYVYLRKGLDFRKIAAGNACSVLCGLLVGVAVALRHRTVWALVLSLLSASVAGLVMSWVLRPYRPRLELRLDFARELFAFGRWVAALNLLNFLCMNVDGLLVGKLLGTQALGLYQMAAQFALLATLEVQAVVFGVTVPAFVLLRSDADSEGTFLRTRAAYLRTLGFVSSIVIPLGCFITVFAGPLVRFALGPQWQPIAPTLRILVWGGVAMALTGITASFYFSLGEPKTPFAMYLIRAALTISLLYPLTSMSGIDGAATASTVATIFAMSGLLIVAHRRIHTTVSELVNTLRFAGIGSVPFLAAAFVSSSLPATLVLVASLAIAAYVVILVTAMRIQFGLTLRPWAS